MCDVRNLDTYTPHRNSEDLGSAFIIVTAKPDVHLFCPDAGFEPVDVCSIGDNVFVTSQVTNQIAKFVGGYFKGAFEDFAASVTFQNSLFLREPLRCLNNVYDVSALRDFELNDQIITIAYTVRPSYIFLFVNIQACF